ncbi:hypothetical protein [Dictyobacter arantiisoli]|uniref:Uncharacterized protein n=1 Tax=Dictyobacter arantiisoli TaxID=2014874 RepID=A0A5A5THP9_9CHLR|nr:hypothetical protein [Dictyobacter arantiisoli]GCF10897.1 hypothetical protein KDI_44610 [Dictyobacter arantiisoli]
MTDYTIYASKRSEVSKSSRNMEHFVVEEDPDGSIAAAAKKELQELGYRVHGVIPRQVVEEEEDETAAPPSTRNGR